MNPDRIKDFALRRAEMQQKIYGRDATLGGTTVKCTISAAEGRLQMEEFGHTADEVEIVVRVPVNLYEGPVAMNDLFTDSRFADRTYRVVEVKDDPLSVEHVFGCRIESSGMPSAIASL